MSATSLFVPLVMRGAHQTAGAAAAIETLSNSDAVQYILADIPLFTVGILAFGTFTFFAFLRRITWVVVCLHISVFLCFSAAILDLIQVLFRGDDLSSATANTNPVLGLIVAREIIYAVSTGVRFLFIWGLVACPPYGEVPSERSEFHSGSWRRWGVFGILLQWILLAVIFAITTLQILYRVLPSLQHFGVVYQTEATMEIVISSVFILKLLMNSYLAGLASSRMRSGWVTVFRYMPIIFALAISISIGVGSLFEFLYSETVLGRFLQAVEIYILVLYVLVTSFVHLRYASLPTPRRTRSSSFQALPLVLSRESSFRIPPPRVSTPDLLEAMQSRTISLNAGSTDQRPSLLAARASIAKLSSWPRRLSERLGVSGSSPPSPNTARDRLWDQRDAEKGMSPRDADAYEIEVQLGQYSFDQSPEEPQENARYQDPLYTSVIRNEASMGNLLASTAASPPAPSTLPPPRLNLFVDVPATASSDETNSPIYGLNGIVRPDRPPTPDERLPTLKDRPLTPDDRPLTPDDRPLTPDDRPPTPDDRPPTPDDDRSISDGEDPRTYFDSTPRSSGEPRVSALSLSGLLRQQEELDRSIAALKLFSEPSSLRTSMSSDGHKPSSATRSDFSLSHFPLPPWRKGADARRRSSSVSRSNLGSAERMVEVVAQSSEVRSQILSVSSMPVSTTETPSVSNENPEYQIPRLETSRTPTEGSPSTVDSAQLVSVVDRERRSNGAPPTRMSRAFLQPIAPSAGPSPRSIPRQLTTDGMRVLAAGSSSLSAVPSVRRKLPTPPQAAGRGAPPRTSVPGLAIRRVGLPSTPRPVDRKAASLLGSGNLFEQPRPAPSPSPLGIRRPT